MKKKIIIIISLLGTLCSHNGNNVFQYLATITKAEKWDEIMINTSQITHYHFIKLQKRSLCTLFFARTCEINVHLCLLSKAYFIHPEGYIYPSYKRLYNILHVQNVLYWGAHIYFIRFNVYWHEYNR